MEHATGIEAIKKGGGGVGGDDREGAAGEVRERGMGTCCEKRR